MFFSVCKFLTEKWLNYKKIVLKGSLKTCILIFYFKENKKIAFNGQTK